VLTDRPGGEAAGRPGGPGDLHARLRRAERDRRRLLRQLLTAQEDERRRLTGYLHDDAVQSLAAALLHLDVLEARLERAGVAASPGIGEGVGRVRQNLEHGLRAARSFLLDLRPHQPGAEGLEAALGLALARLAEAGCATELDWSLEGRLDGDLETVLFRALQEALANVAKHARATIVRVEVRVDAGAVVARVDDDGVGFDPVETRAWARATGHLGLRFMAERIQAAGGRVRVDSTPGQGTRIVLRVPLAAAR
jgi:signal transduction histidine kinase